MTVAREFAVETRGIGKPDYSISGSVDVAVGDASSFRSGIDANKPALPMVGDIWLARDTKKLYVCHTAGVWSGFDASILIQGILTLYANLAGGGYQIKNIANPTAAQDAATKASVDSKVTTHEEKATGVHGVGASTVCSETEAANKITTHKDIASAHHPRYIDTEAQTTVKANVEVGDLKAPTKALAMNSQKITGLLAPTAPGDALRKGTVLTLTEIPTPLTGKDADTVDGAHKTDLEGTMDTKITTHGTGGKHRWTLDKLLKGAGAGANPTEVDDPTDKLDDISQAQPTRELDGIYQNGTKIRVVTVTLNLGASEYARVFVGSSSPDTAIAYFRNDNASAIIVPGTFIVLPNYYYKVEIVGGAPTINYWVEWDLH